MAVGGCHAFRHMSDQTGISLQRPRARFRSFNESLERRSLLWSWIIAFPTMPWCIGSFPNICWLLRFKMLFPLRSQSPWWIVVQCAVCCNYPVLFQQHWHFRVQMRMRDCGPSSRTSNRVARVGWGWGRGWQKCPFLLSPLQTSSKPHFPHSREALDFLKNRISVGGSKSYIL